VLRTSKDFQFRDVELLVRHINGTWQSEVRPRVICLWDKASQEYDLGNVILLPLKNNWQGVWSRMDLYSPAMEKYRPYLYIDLDTAVISSLENVISLIKDPSQFIVLEDFYQKGKLATGLAWIPAGSKKVSDIWNAWLKKGVGKSRMDYFLREATTPDGFWQQATDTIKDFKPIDKKLLVVLPPKTDVVCFHGKPRIHECVNGSITIEWVKEYVNTFYKPFKPKRKVTVIIPYKKDRGWLQDAIDSVPEGVQLLVSQGEGNWPANFNKVLNEATGDYIKYLHEDDMLTPNCIEDSINAIEEQGVDFIHGQAIELTQKTGNKILWQSPNKFVTLTDLLLKNTIHSVTLMYRKEVFEKIGSFDETLNTAEEYEFNLRCLKAGLKIGYCDTPLAIYRRHDQQKVRVVSKKEKDKEKWLKHNINDRTSPYINHRDSQKWNFHNSCCYKSLWGFCR
jgi:hypothetical protein